MAIEKIEFDVEKFGEEITEKVTEALEPLTKIANKLESASGDPENPTGELEGQDKVAAYLRAVATGDLATVKSLSGGTDSEGGYLIPDEFHAEVLRIAEEHGIARRDCRVVPMRRSNAQFPTSTSGVVVSWPGEGAAASESDPGFGLAQLSVKTMAALTALENELLEDADVDVVAFIETLFGEAVAKEEDTQVLVGSGAPFGGVLNHADANVVTMASTKTAFSDVTADNLLDMIDGVATGAKKDAKFYMHGNIITHLRKLKDDNGQYIWDKPTGDKPGRIWGYAYEETDVMPGNAASAVSTKFVVFGSLKNVLFGDRKQMTMDLSKDATVGGVSLFERNMQAVRITERIAVAIGIGSAFSVLRTAAS